MADMFFVNRKNYHMREFTHIPRHPCYFKHCREMAEMKRKLEEEKGEAAAAALSREVNPESETF